jgi:hypothetical protein
MTKKLIPVLSLILYGFTLCAQTFTDHTYNYSNAVFNNPERGFYRYTERDNAKNSLDLGTLTSYYNSGYTLIYRIFYLREFVNSPISLAYLDKIREDFALMREAGIKGIIRFAYTSSMNPPYGDATLEQIKVHIDQLKPILTENSDVILVLQAGFIGAWGEWYYTDHFATGSPSNVTKEDMQKRKELINCLLNAIPKDRMIQVRYVGYKMKMFDSIPVNQDEAYSGSPKSRISHHNDCFVSSDDDVGSYRNIKFEKNYLQQDTKYTSIGGETCDWYEPRSNCDTSIHEMERFHWSFINQDYYGQTIKEWQDNGCYTTMQLKLGYRYYLISSIIQDTSRPAGTFRISFKLKNIGFSNPINPRSVEIILKNKQTGQQFSCLLNTELRKNELKSIINLTALIGIPSYIPEGNYDVFLNLPDPHPALNRNPLYSVRLANQLLWDQSSGFNSFMHTLHITHDYSQESSFAGNYFQPYEENSLSLFRVDGNSEDWNFIPVKDSSLTNQRLKKIKVFDSNDTLFFLLQGENLYPNSQLFIDSDLDPNTGMNYTTWADDSGIDYLIQNDQIFSYGGTDGSDAWDWRLLSEGILRVGNDSTVELAIPKKLFSAASLNTIIKAGVKTMSADWSAGESIPAGGAGMMEIQLRPSINFPRIKMTSWCQNTIFSFIPEEQDTDAIVLVERRKSSSDRYSTIAVLAETGPVYFNDKELEKDGVFNYRASRFNNKIRSSLTRPVQIISSGCQYKYPEIHLMNGEDDWNAVPPIGAALYENTEFYFKVYCSKDYLNLFLTGDSIKTINIYIDSDNNPSTGLISSNWGSSGFDFKCTAANLYKFQSGSFVLNASLDSVRISNNMIELKVPVTLLGLENNQSVLNFGLVIYRNGIRILIPYPNWNILPYERTLPAVKPSNFSVRRSAETPSSKLIATWDKCTNCDGYVLLRNNMSTNEQSVFTLNSNDNQLIDNGLNANTWYEYRVYSYNFAGISEIAGPLSLNTVTGVSAINEPYSIRLYPDPTMDMLHIDIPEDLTCPITISIHDLTGRLILEKNIPSRIEEGPWTVTISTGKFERGMVYVVINTNNIRYISKIILI